MSQLPLPPFFHFGFFSPLADFQRQSFSWRALEILDKSNCSCEVCVLDSVGTVVTQWASDMFCCDWSLPKSFHRNVKLPPPALPPYSLLYSSTLP